MRDYIRNIQESFKAETLANMAFLLISSIRQHKKNFFCVTASSLTILVLALVIAAHREIDNISLGTEANIQLTTLPIAATAEKKGTISIPSGTVKLNPFLPYSSGNDKEREIIDIPSYDLVAPPEMINENSNAARVMDTIVSGILFDKFSPSAILNIEGNDYLVKKGDVVNNYKVLHITRNSVTVKLGENTYEAGIGEILTEGTLNHNDVSNLNNKFGGVNNELQ